MILVKSLTTTESTVAIIFWMLVVQSVIGLVPAALVWRTPGAAVWPWIVVIALCGTYSHYCMTQALRHADATMIVPMDFLRVPLTAARRLARLRRAASTSSPSSAPALILVANLLNLRRAAPAPKEHAHGDVRHERHSRATAAAAPPSRAALALAAARRAPGSTTRCCSRSASSSSARSAA